MVAWRVFRAIIDPTNRTVLQLMTSHYRDLLLANDACVARLTCVSLCQFKELVPCTVRFLTFRTLPASLFTNLSQCIVLLSYFCMVARTTECDCVRLVIVVRFRDYVARDISTFQISGGTSFLCFAFPASVSSTFFSSLTDFSDTAQTIFYPLYTLVFANTLLRVRTPRNDSRSCFR